jgi:hypothetical protein
MQEMPEKVHGLNKPEKQGSPVLPADISEKYNIVYGYEEQFAYKMAKEVVKKPETSVWMILMPILFVHHMYRIKQYKENVRSFAGNILSTKLKALDKASKEAAAGRKITYGLGDYFPGVPLDSDQEKVLAEKQVRVIRIMEEHYLALFQAPGNSMEELIRGAYRSSEAYRSYLSRLSDSEREVSRYLMKHFHTTEEARSVAVQIEKQCAGLRESEIGFFFKA